MKESSTYQAIIAEGTDIGKALGKAEEAQSLLLKIGTKRLGEPDATTQAKVTSLKDVERVESLALRVLDVETWSELLAEDQISTK